MIKIQINKTNNKYSSLVVSGHSNYDEHGKDIVCAGVSAIVTGGINALILEDKKSISYEIKDGYVNLDVLNIENNNIQLIIDVIVVQLKTIEESYKKHVKIYEK